MPSESPAAWTPATQRLLEDPAFGPIVEQVGPVQLRPPRGSPFGSLAAAIVYQQLAGKAARTIHSRFVAVLEDDVAPQRVLALSDEELRAVGLSRNKMAAIRDLAARVHAGDLVLDDLGRLSDGEVVDRLTQVRGIGAWTAHMYLMFDLRRPDVWPTGDLGVRAGLARIFRLPETPAPSEMELMGYGYRPWRSAAAWYCWRALDIPTP